LENYTLSDSNYLAISRLRQDGMLPLHRLRPGFDTQEISPASRAFFSERLRQIEPSLVKHWLYSYANPVIGRYKIE